MKKMQQPVRLALLGLLFLPFLLTGCDTLNALTGDSMPQGDNRPVDIYDSGDMGSNPVERRVHENAAANRSYSITNEQAQTRKTPTTKVNSSSAASTSASSSAPANDIPAPSVPAAPQLTE